MIEMSSLQYAFSKLNFNKVKQDKENYKKKYNIKNMVF